MLAFFIVKPFLPAVILGAVIAYLFYPVYSRIKKYIKNAQLSAVLTLLIITLIFTIPVVVLMSAMIGEISDFYIKTGNNIHAREINGISGILSNKCTNGDDSMKCRIGEHITGFISDDFVKGSFRNFISNVYIKLVGSIPSILLSIPAVILFVLIVVFVIFYIFLDWESIVKELDFLLPFREDMKKAFAKQVKDIIHATVYGNIVVALVQGAIGAAAFFVFDSTKAPVFWGFIMAIAAFVPFIGTSLVWLPIGVMQILNGYTNSSDMIIWRGIGLLIVGLTIISTIDNIIKPRLIGRRAEIHPLLVLLGVLGGIGLFGFIGFIVGPLVIALLVSLIKFYRKDKHEIIG